MLETFTLVTCDQCKDTERSRECEKLGDFMRRIRKEGWVAWLSGDNHYCSVECRDFQNPVPSGDRDGD